MTDQKTYLRSTTERSLLEGIRPKDVVVGRAEFQERQSDSGSVVTDSSVCAPGTVAPTHDVVDSDPTVGRTADSARPRSVAGLHLLTYFLTGSRKNHPGVLGNLGRTKLSKIKGGNAFRATKSSGVSPGKPPGKTYVFGGVRQVPNPVLSGSGPTSQIGSPHVSQDQADHGPILPPGVVPGKASDAAPGMVSEAINNVDSGAFPTDLRTGSPSFSPADSHPNPILPAWPISPGGGLGARLESAVCQLERAIEALETLDQRNQKAEARIRELESLNLQALNEVDQAIGLLDGVLSLPLSALDHPQAVDTSVADPKPESDQEPKRAKKTAKGNQIPDAFQNSD